MSHLRTVFTLKSIQRVPSLKPSLILETAVFFLELFPANIFRIIVQNCVSKCDFSHSEKPEFQNFPGEHAPKTP